MSAGMGSTGARRILAALLLAATALGTAGCAGTRGPVSGPGADPWEPFNRKVFAFNEALDDAVLAPVARGYEAVVPEMFRDMAGNVFSNLGNLWTAANQLLQGKPKEAFSDLASFAINTVFSLGGLADVASSMGLEKHREDFGQTLGTWGVAPGPYLVLPVFGPSTLRDAPAFAVDVSNDPLLAIDRAGQRNHAYALRLIDTRAGLLRGSRLIEGAALDKYSFVRDGWLQRRRSQIYDGDPPPEPQQADDAPADGQPAKAPAR